MSPKLRKLLLALGDAKIVEEKTSNPANYPDHRGRGSDPARRDAARKSRVAARDGSISVIVGKPSGPGYFARRGGENQQLSGRTAAVVGSGTPVLDRLAADRCADDNPSRASRSNPRPARDTSFSGSSPTRTDSASTARPPGRKALDAHALAPSATMLSALDRRGCGGGERHGFQQARPARSSPCRTAM